MWTCSTFDRVINILLLIALVVSITINFVDIGFKTKVYSNEANCIVEVDE